MMAKAAFLVAALLLAAGCSSQPGGDQAAGDLAAPSRHAESGLRIIPLSVMTAEGPRRFDVEVAATPEEQQQGLMFRKQLGPDEGMIFPSQMSAERSFWMKNTVIPLDIIFIGADRRVLSIHADAQPYSLDPIPSGGAVINVLEIAGGRAAQLGIRPGDPVAW